MHKCCQSWVATAQGEEGKQGIWIFIFPDKEFTNNNYRYMFLHKNLPPTP